MDQHQFLTSDRRDEATVSEVIRPAAIVPEEAARRSPAAVPVLSHCLRTPADAP